MEPYDVSPKYITSCPSCYEICSEIHPSNLRHHTIGTHVLETQIESILNQNYDQWLDLFQKLQTSIHTLIQEITHYLQRLDQTVNQYRNVLVLNQHLKPKEDQQIISKAIGKLSQFKYNDLNCDQISRTIQALKDKEPANDLSVNEQFEKMEDKILFDLHQIVSMNFSCLQNKSLEKCFETQSNQIKDNQKSTQSFVNEIDSTQISKKIQEIMKEQIQKIKPLINQQIQKAKSNIVTSQQASKIYTVNKQDQQQIQMPKTDQSTKIYGTFKENYHSQQKNSFKKLSSKEQLQNQRVYKQYLSSKEQFDEQNSDSEKSQSQYSYQNTQPFRRSEADKSQTQSMTNTQKEKKSVQPFKISHCHKKLGSFNCVVKVLVIFQKQMKFEGKICTRFLGGDKTGTALFMIEHSSLLEPGNNIFIEHIKWANFNHEKQAHFTEKTKISLDNDPIKFIGTFRIGESAAKICEEKAKQIQVLICKQHAKLNREKKQVKIQYIQKTKPQESKKNTRVQQEKKSQPQKPVPPPSNPRAQPSTSQNQNANQSSQQSPASTFKKFKISQIKPNQTGCWITGQVLKVISSNSQKKIILLGDQTGVVNCEIQCAGNKQIKQGVYVYLQSFNAIAVDGFVLMRQSAKGKIILWNEAPPSIDRKNKISEKIFL